MKKLKSLLLLLLCGIMFLTFAVGSSSDSPKKSLERYNINDDIYITNSDGRYRIKITNVSETSYRNSYSDVKADRVVIIEYEYENLTMDDDLYISQYLNFKAYDKDNNELESYPADTKYGGSIGKGRKSTASIAYALNNDNDYIELEYYDNFLKDANCQIILNW